MIQITSVTRRFGRATAVDAVSISIAQGESLALWGVNGAGKTTLIRCVLGLLSFEGTISIAGHDVTRKPKHARMLMGYVPQELAFYDDLGVAEAVVFFARLKGVSVRAPRELLADVGLQDHHTKRVRELSGGMKQRLALAIALLGDPPVLVLDEVTASLDACGRTEFVSLLSQLSGSGRTMLFASHRVDEITALAGRVVQLEQGRVVRSTTSREFGAALDTSTTLHLTLEPRVRESALAVLRESGFAPRLNGVGILVPVSADQKAAPFRLLAQARISIDDFEILSASHAHRNS